VLRGSPRKPCAGFSPGRHLRNFRQFQPTNRKQWSAIRAAGIRRLTFSILVSFPAVAVLPAAYKRAADARPTLPTSHNCRDTSPSCRLLSSSSIAEKLPAGHTPDHTPILRPVRLVERRGGWRPGQSGPAARSGGLAAVLSFPFGKIDGAAAGFSAARLGGYEPAAGSGVPGQENQAADGSLRPSMPPGSEAGKRRC
jgi:hypothetical protein